MSTSTITGVVGAAVGYVVSGFNPAGAYYGWVIGSAVGAAIDPQVIPGPRVGDSGQQLAQEGGPLNIVFGTSPPLAGTLVACQPEPDIVKKTQSQGKGGPKVETETAYRTYAIAYAEGECEFVQVWKNGTLVYDADDPAMASNNAEFLKVARFYSGSYDQMPSPDLEAVFGVGHVHPFRGRAYMVLAREDVTRMDGAVSQYQVRLRRGARPIATTPPYPYVLTESIDISSTPRKGTELYFQPERVGVASVALDGALQDILKAYSNYDPEPIEVSSMALGGSLSEPLVSYQHYDPEGVGIGSTAQGGTLDVVLIPYQNYDPESVDIASVALGGTLDEV